MRSKKRAAVIAAALAASSILVSAPTASAAIYCSSSGYTEGGFPNLRCTKLSNGVVSHGQRDTFPTVTLSTSYYKSGGSTVSVRLGYTQAGTTVYSSYFNISSSQTVTKSWTRNHKDYWCYNSVGILQQSGGTSYQTPAAHC
ncbi:hypothetical protein [Streptomyces sp. NPDC002122]|uniref:hypothetical protein n=1 Tax=Streptomyces sp. NPDC002122 TaxID=3154407 RepID=UPI0033328AFB